jgi:hypothetical protein
MAAMFDRFLPLILGLAVGIVLVKVMGSLSTKWAIFMVGLAAASAFLVLIGSMTRHLSGSLLFLAILSLPTFYGISFLFRAGTKFSVLANGFTVTLFDVILGLLAAGWLYRAWTDPKHPKLEFPRSWAIVMGLLVLINLISASFVAREPFYAFSMLYEQMKCFAIAYFLANYLRTEQQFRLVAYALAGILLFEGIVVLEQRFVGAVFTAENLGKHVSLTSRAGMGTLLRLAGTLDHPNALAMYLNLILPIAFFLWVIETNVRRKIALTIAIALALTAEIWSGSRGGWLGLASALGIGIYFWSKKQGRNPLIGLSITAFVTVLIFATLFAASTTFRTRLVEGDAGAAEVRFPLMDVAMEMIKANPVSGVGLNLYTREMVPYDRTNNFIAYRYNQPVHNTFLMVGAETGIPSLLCIAIFIYLMLRESYRVFRLNDGILSVVGIGSLGIWTAWIMHNQVNLSSPYNDQLLWLLVGLLAAAHQYTNRLLKNQAPIPNSSTGS